MLENRKPELSNAISTLNMQTVFYIHLILWGIVCIKFSYHANKHVVVISNISSMTSKIIQVERRFVLWNSEILIL
jgi:hypothetical protein